MKLSYNWLKQYVAVDWTPVALAERLMMAGIEVEDIKTFGASFDDIVTAKILTSDKHPNADRLSVCRVTDGKTERQIVCGAKNYKVGDIVPLALPGCTLPAASPDGKPFTIKEAKLRGVDSQGMMCSPKELGLAEDAQGLMILPAETPVGVPFAQIVGGGDTIFDLEITPNRPDWLSVIGIGREVAALTGNPLKLPEIKIGGTDGDNTGGFTVRVQDPVLCPRYTARLIRGVKIGPSPRWMQERLESGGLRPINNIVDITNYVLLECGQPLHAFDYNLLANHEIIVRRAGAGETIQTIDGKVRPLTADVLVIADATKAVALAGIMGGSDCEINARTVDVLLESAYFDPRNIRATSKKTGLSSESSYRFERGADIGICDWASQRAAALMAELGGAREVGKAIYVCARPIERGSVSLRFDRVNKLIGVSIEPSQVQSILASLGLALRDADLAKATFSIPTYRVDLEQEADLIEEVCRIHGANNIPSVVSIAAPGESPHDGQHDFHMRLRNLASALGFDEAINYTLLGPDAPLHHRGAKLANPLSEDYSVLRTSLLAGLLASVAHNVGHKNPDLRLFELGRVFSSNVATLEERICLGLLLTGRRTATYWEGGQPGLFDVFDLKGAIEELLRQVGIESLSVTNVHSPAFTPNSAGVITAQGEALGEFGEVDPVQCARLKITTPVFYAELDLGKLLRLLPNTKRFKPLPQYPAIVRDIAMVLDESRTHQEVLDAIQQAYRAASREEWLTHVQPFDIFRGGSIPTGKKSMAYSLTYRSAERTLTDVEVNALHQRVADALKMQLDCEIRQ